MPRVETNEIQTYYESHGEGQPIVFVHGLTMDRRTWRPQIDALADEYEVITYDYRGHGKSETGDPSKYSVSLLVDDLRALIEELDVENPVLCGHSYGGLIIAEYAHQYPDEVAALAFADARTELGEKVWERAYLRFQPAIHRIEDLVGEDRVGRVQTALVKRLEDAEREANPEIAGLGMTVNEYEDAASGRVKREVETELMQAGLDYIGASPTAFDVPVLYAYGENGVDLIKGKAERLRRAPTDVRVREIETADHYVSLQRPEQFNGILRDFLADIHESRQQTEEVAS